MTTLKEAAWAVLVTLLLIGPLVIITWANVYGIGMGDDADNQTDWERRQECKVIESTCEGN